MKTVAALGFNPDRVEAGPLTTAFRQEITWRWFMAFGANCLFCGVPMVSRGSGPNRATVDHIDARCLGGTDALSNLQVICSRCNLEKSYAEREVLERR
jgi:5-methylcytosine-specific restriction endonuclease McrA